MRPIRTSAGVARTHRRGQLQLTGSLSLPLVVCCLVASSVVALGADHSAQVDALLDGTDQQSVPLARQLLGARFRRQTARSASDATGSAVAQLASQLSQQQSEQDSVAPLENDEQILGRQLPDLIAQAHTDKAIERNLLRLIINASLRSKLSNLAGVQQSPASGWQLDSVDNSNNNLAQYNQANSASMGEFVPIRLARLEQSDYANLDPQLAIGLASSAGQEQLQQQQHHHHHHQRPYQYQSTSMDKREYIKPCSFNAISCVRTPFRRLIEANRAT